MKKALLGMLAGLLLGLLLSRLLLHGNSSSMEYTCYESINDPCVLIEGKTASCGKHGTFSVDNPVKTNFLYQGDKKGIELSFFTRDNWRFASIVNTRKGVTNEYRFLVCGTRK